VVVKLLKVFIKIPSQDSVDATFVLLNTCGYKLNEHNKKDLNKIVNNVHNKSTYNMRFAKKVSGIMIIVHLYHSIGISLNTKDLKNITSDLILHLCFTFCGTSFYNNLTQLSNLMIFLTYLPDN